MTMVDDDTLQRLVLDELRWQSSVNAAKIGVIAEQGVVTLTGHVDSYAEKVAAERAASGVNGVKAIAQEIEVILPSEHRRTDEDIAMAALKVLEWDASVPHEHLHVQVEKGWITLRGDVDRQHQRAAADHDVHKLVGVIGVTNAIKVRQSATPQDIGDRIEAALRRDASLEASGIRLVVEGGKIILTGKVHSWYERERAERAAWSAPGVSEVENRIAVEW